MKVWVQKVGCVFNKQVFIFRSTRTAKSYSAGESFLKLFELAPVDDYYDECKWCTEIQVGEGKEERTVSLDLKI